MLDGTKLPWHRDRIEAWLQGERIAPITIDCALTRRCTYRCKFCYGMLQANDEKRMTRDVIFRFLDDAAEIGVKAISFISDGESTCSPHLRDAILRGRQNGLDIGLGTNGYLLKDEDLEEILPALSYLRFNFCAANPERYAYIHGVNLEYFHEVFKIIASCVRLKRAKNLNVTLNLQMVLMPDFGDQILPLARLGKNLGVDYTIFKHCSDDELHSLGVDYSQYSSLFPLLRQAEGYSDENYLVKAKWSKLLAGDKREYTQCYGPPFIAQFSGSGLVAPCGMLFNQRYKKRFHIGNLVETSFKKLWQSERYWEVMDELASPRYDAGSMCGYLCLQHAANIYLNNLKQGNTTLEEPLGEPPLHINFI